jgi:hypothetical protein
VQFAEVVLAPAQWVRQSAVIQSLVLMFLTSVPMGMKFVHHLQWKKQLSFQLNGIAQSVVTQQVAIATTHPAQK